MKKTGLFALVLFAATSLFAGEVLTGDAAKAMFPEAYRDTITEAKTTKICKGVDFSFARFSNLFGYKTELFVLRIDYKNSSVRMLAHDQASRSPTRVTTSKAASMEGALFAINGDMEGSVNGKLSTQMLFKGDGTVYPSPSDCCYGLAFNGRQNKNLSFGTFCKPDKSGGTKLDDNWENFVSCYAQVHNGNNPMEGGNTKTRQEGGYDASSRTFMGMTPDGILYAVVTDGKNRKDKEGAKLTGLNYHECFLLLKGWGCTEGQQLDGGGSSCIAIRKDALSQSDFTYVQRASADDSNYWLMNDPGNNLTTHAERAVINHIVFIEEVCLVTPNIGNHGSCSLGTQPVKFGYGENVSASVSADTGYVIAQLETNGVAVANALGKKTLGFEFVTGQNPVTITATFAKETAWWLKPKVVNDFAVAKYIKKNIYEGAAVAVDENNQNVYFGLSTHSYNSASNGVVGYAVADLVSGKSTPTCGTRAMYNDAGIALNTEYVKDIAVSATAKALLVGRKTGATNPYAIVCPLGKSWGDPEYANYNVSAKDARFLLQNDINFNDGATSVTQDSIFQCAFSPDGKRLYAAAGYSGNGSRYVLEYNVQADASGAMTGIQPTGKIFKFSTTVFSLACGKVNGKYLLIGTDTNGMLGMIAPDDFKADGNGFVSSTAQTRYEKIGKFTGMCVTGAEDGTPRLIGSVANGQFSVYDIKPDCSGLVSTTPIVTYDHYLTFDNTGMDAFACTSDDQTAFFSYTVIGEGSRKSLYAKVVQVDLPPPPEGSPDNPWQIGGATESDSISVQTNGTGGLVIGGEGASADGMMALPTGFDRNAIKHVTVGDGVTKLGSRFLKDFRRMTTLTCGSGVASFGDKALYRCLLLEEVEIANANFDLDSLAKAIVYQMAIKEDGTLYMIPKVTVAGYTEMLYGKQSLTDADWTEIGPLAEQNLEELKKAGQYHFFQTRLVK